MPATPVGIQGLTLVGVRPLVRALHLLGPRVERRVLGNALRAAMRPITTATKQNARARTGKESAKAQKWRKAFASAGMARYRLYDTVKQVSRTYAGKKMVVAGTVYGEDYAFKGNVGHLVERGHKKVIFGRRTGGRVPPHPFMKPAWDANVGRAQAILNAKVASGLAREAAKARTG